MNEKSKQKFKEQELSLKNSAKPSLLEDSAMVALSLSFRGVVFFLSFRGGLATSPENGS